MTTKTLPLAEARRKLGKMSKELHDQGDVVAVTRRGEPVLALLPWDLFESLVETLEVLSDESLLRDLRQSLSEAAKGQTIPLQTVIDELG